MSPNVKATAPNAEAAAIQPSKNKGLWKASSADTLKTLIFGDGTIL